MSPLLPNRPEDDEEFLARLVRQSGNPVVEPRPEHIAQVRSAIFARLETPVSTRRRNVAWFAVAFVVAASLLILFALPWLRTRILDDREVAKQTDRQEHRNEDFGGKEPGASWPAHAAIDARREGAVVATAWGSARRDLDLALLPAYCWPVSASQTKSVSALLPAELSDQSN